MHALGFLNQQSTLYLNSKSSLFHTRWHSSPVSSCLPYYSMCACSIRQCKMSLGHCHQSLQRTKEVAFPREEQKYPGTNQLSITLVTKHFGHHRALYHPDGLQQWPFVSSVSVKTGLHIINSSTQKLLTVVSTYLVSTKLHPSFLQKQEIPNSLVYFQDIPVGRKWL